MAPHPREEVGQVAVHGDTPVGALELERAGPRQRHERDRQVAGHRVVGALVDDREEMVDVVRDRGLEHRPVEQDAHAPAHPPVRRQDRHRPDVPAPVGVVDALTLQQRRRRVRGDLRRQAVERHQPGRRVADGPQAADRGVGARVDREEERARPLVGPVDARHLVRVVPEAGLEHGALDRAGDVRHPLVGELVADHARPAWPRGLGHQTSDLGADRGVVQRVPRGRHAQNSRDSISLAPKYSRVKATASAASNGLQV